MKMLLLRAVETGEKLEMIYMSATGDLTQRVIKVASVNDDSVLAYCYTRRQSRMFKMNNVLSIMPLRKHHRIGA